MIRRGDWVAGDIGSTLPALTEECVCLITAGCGI